MTPQKSYNKHSPAKIIFALALLISLSFFSGVGGSSVSAFQQEIKTELVVSFKAKTPGWIKSLHKKFSSRTFTQSSATENFEAGFLLAYNKLIEVKFDNLSRKYSLIKSPDSFFRIKTIPRSSKENDFNSFTG